MNRGSSSPIRNGANGVKRFNEAPIHESGKFLLIGLPALVRICFNEAPIHESGKCERDGVLKSMHG